ncbi:MAG: hypothetical protein PHD30_05845, partial [Paludibacter sp.]|nr:hypothetical protein [Paludibacter sp.]
LFKFPLFILSVITIACIIILLIKIDPLSIRVDRWSAVTYFLDSLFKGEYPYATHTHVSENNFPSPFPMWYIINLPFYLTGDVGVGLIVFLCLIIYTFYLFSKSFKRTFAFLILIILSPAYWWEVAVRSDSLNNGILVLCIILFYYVKKLSIERNLILIAFMSGIIASTRLSAILPIALFIFPSFLKISFSKKTTFISIVTGFVLLTFLPFILWDTESWIFFRRNPFMSQSSIGNPLLLLVMIILGIFMAMKWHNLNQFLNLTSIFIFIFILTSQLNLIFTRGINESVFTDSLYDISYFSLLLPYCIAFLANNITTLTPSLSDS